DTVFQVSVETSGAHARPADKPSGEAVVPDEVVVAMNRSDDFPVCGPRQDTPIVFVGALLVPPSPSVSEPDTVRASVAPEVLVTVWVLRTAGAPVDVAWSVGVPPSPAPFVPPANVRMFPPLNVTFEPLTPI